MNDYTDQPCTSRHRAQRDRQDTREFSGSGQFRQLSRSRSPHRSAPSRTFSKRRTFPPPIPPSQFFVPFPIPTALFFSQAQTPKVPQSTLCAWDEMSAKSASAAQKTFGTAQKSGVERTSKEGSSLLPAPSCVTIGTLVEVAPPPFTDNGTNSPDVEKGIMGHKIVLEHRRKNPLTPYKFRAWDRLLRQHNLLAKYPRLVVYKTASTLEYVEFIKPLPHPMVLLWTHLPTSTKKLLTESYIPDATLGRFPGARWNNLLVPFSHRRCPWFCYDFGYRDDRGLHSCLVLSCRYLISTVVD
jgi:hypothetical protein